MVSLVQGPTWYSHCAGITSAWKQRSTSEEILWNLCKILFQIWISTYIGSTDFHSGIQTCTIMSIDDVSCDDSICSNSTVVRTEILNQFWVYIRNCEYFNSHPCGAGKPLLGHPNGRPSESSIVYSCSIPNHASSSLHFSQTSAQALRWFVSNGVPSYLKVSHITKMLLPRRNGSR